MDSHSPYWVTEDNLFILTVRHLKQIFHRGEILRAKDFVIGDDPMRGPIM